MGAAAHTSKKNAEEGFECAQAFMELLLGPTEDIAQHMFIAKDHRRFARAEYFVLWKLAGPERGVGTDAAFTAAWRAANPQLDD